MPRFGLVFALLICSNMALAAPLPSLAQKIRDLSALEQELSAFKNHTEKELKALKEQEKNQRRKMITTVHHTSRKAMEIARLAHFPQKALMLSDALSGNTHRTNIIRMSRSHMVQKIEADAEEILTIHTQRAAAQERMNTAEKAQESLSASKKILQNLQTSSKKWDALSSAEQQAAQRSLSRITLPKNFKELLAAQESETRNDVHIPADKLPTAGSITRMYGDADSVGLKAKGITIAAIPGAPVKALDDGRITYSGPFAHYGNVVIVQHKDKSHAVYGGLGVAQKQVDQLVFRDDPVGYLPATQAPELYFELRKKGEPVDPKPWLD